MATPQKFTKKPVEIEAMQFRNWGDAITIMDWADGVYYVGAGAEHRLRRQTEHDPGNGHVYEDIAPPYLVVKTLEGDMRADSGDWIVRGVQGEFYPCKPDIFAATYDPAPADPEEDGPDEGIGYRFDPWRNDVPR